RASVPGSRMAILRKISGPTALSLCPMWHEAVFAGTERYLTRFHCETRIHGLSWRERDQQPLANQGTNSGTHPGEGPAARLKAEAHLCTASYLRPHHGAGGFRTAAQVPP